MECNAFEIEEKCIKYRAVNALLFGYKTVNR